MIRPGVGPSTTTVSGPSLWPSQSFNTEIGAEVYFRTGPWLAMAGVTGGVNVPGDRGPAYLTKLDYDQQLSPAVRVRLTGSMYDVNKTPSNNLFNGDRTGSRFASPRMLRVYQP